MKNLAVVVGYIMYYRLLEDKINGSFFSQIDVAVDLAQDFILTFSDEEKNHWSGDLNFEDTLVDFINSKK